jgi:hypothetical protein
MKAEEKAREFVVSKGYGKNDTDTDRISTGHLINMLLEYANQQPEQEKVDLISLSMQHSDKMNKELDETGLVPNWWRGVVTISMTAIEEFENILQTQDNVREAAEKVVCLYDSDYSKTKDHERVFDEAIDDLRKALNQNKEDDNT